MTDEVARVSFQIGDLAGFEKIGGPPPGVNCFFSPPAGSFYWGGWWAPKPKPCRELRLLAASPETQK